MKNYVCRIAIPLLVFWALVGCQKDDFTVLPEETDLLTSEVVDPTTREACLKEIAVLSLKVQATIEPVNLQNSDLYDLLQQLQILPEEIDPERPIEKDLIANLKGQVVNMQDYGLLSEKVSEELIVSIDRLLIFKYPKD